MLLHWGELLRWNIITPVLTFRRSFVSFENVDAIFNVSKLCLHFLKESFNLLVRPCIETVVDVVTMLCGWRTDWGAIGIISWLSWSLTRQKQHQEQQTATEIWGNISHCVNLMIKAQLMLRTGGKAVSDSCLVLTRCLHTSQSSMRDIFHVFRTETSVDHCFALCSLFGEKNMHAWMSSVS